MVKILRWHQDSQDCVLWLPVKLAIWELQAYFFSAQCWSAWSHQKVSSSDCRQQRQRQTNVVFVPCMWHTSSSAATGESTHCPVIQSGTRAACSRCPWSRSRLWNQSRGGDKNRGCAGFCSYLFYFFAEAHGNIWPHLFIEHGSSPFLLTQEDCGKRSKNLCDVFFFPQGAPVISQQNLLPVLLSLNLTCTV